MLLVAILIQNQNSLNGFERQCSNQQSCTCDSTFLKTTNNKILTNIVFKKFFTLEYFNSKIF